MFGTYCGLLLLLDVLLRPRAVASKVLLSVLGLLTLSMAFAVFLAGVLAFYASKKPLLTLIILVIVVGAVAILLPGAYLQAFFELLVKRFEPDSSIGGIGLAGDSRYFYWPRFVDYISNAPITQLLFGNGAYSNNQLPDAQFAAFFEVIFEAGFVGFLGILITSLYFLLWLPIRYRAWPVLWLTIPHVLAYYNRADHHGVFYMLTYAIVS